MIEALDGVADRCGAQEGLVGTSGRYTWSETRSLSLKIATHLRQIGVRQSDRVACSLPNDVDCVLAFFATMRLGAVWVGVHPQLATTEKQFLLEDCGARLLITNPDGVPSSGAVAVVCIDRALEGEWTEILAIDDRDTAFDPPDPFTAAALAYTSGTTGRPKAAIHSQRNLVLPGVVQRHRDDGHLVRRLGQCLPLSILNIMILGPVAAAITDATFVAMDRRDAHGVAHWARTEKLEHYIAAPPTVFDLISDDSILAEDLSSVTHPTIGGAGFPNWYRDAYENKFGARLRTGYGMTEAPTSVAIEPLTEPPRRNSSGRAQPHLDITIRGVDGSELPIGELGEICVAPLRTGPLANTYTPMLGYWGQPEATEDALRDGVYHSGDVGYFDADGWLYVVDRREDLILRGGANVYPAEVERVIAEHPGVVACAVMGRPHERLGTEVVAVYEAIENTCDLSGELEVMCSTHLAAYKVPCEFIRVDELPRNQMGKIVRSDLATGELSQR